MKKIVLIVAILCVSAAYAQPGIINAYAGNGFNAETGTGGYTGDGGQATAAELFEPYGVATDTKGNVYFSDYGNNVIRKVNSLGIISTIAGNGTAGFVGDGGPATAAEFHTPAGIALDAIGNIYIADQANARIRMINTLGIINTIAGNGSSGYNGDGIAATTAKLSSPVNVALDATGNLYIADQYNYRIRKVNTLGVISTFAGKGLNTFTGDGGVATAAGIGTSLGVAVDVVGNVYIADYGDKRIRVVNTMGIINTFAGTGTSGYTGDGGAATAAEIGGPYHVVSDAVGNIYFADVQSEVVRKINTAGIISTVVGCGNSGNTGDGGAATTAKLYSPSGLAFDAGGNLYITDWYNNRVRKVNGIGGIMGIEQFQEITSVIIYPNPNNGSFVIETNLEEKQVVNMQDLNGKVVLSQTFNNKTNIDASSLNAGIYYINIISKESVVNKRVVIVK